MIEYPTGSNRQYLYGGLWIGGVRNNDTLVSTGWGTYTEGNSEWWASRCEWEERVSTRFSGQFCDQYHADSTVSDHDVVIWYADTLTDPQFASSDPYEGRKHVPLGIEFEERSYSWAEGAGSEFVIYEYHMTNIGMAKGTESGRTRDTLRDLYIGYWGEPRCAYPLDPFYGWDDNLVGLIQTAQSPLRPEITETFNTVWVADNDGDPGDRGFDRFSVPDVVGFSILRMPSKLSGVSFNWWVWSRPNYDWGPVRRSSKVQFREGGLGEPLGDRPAYQMMSNGEIDYPQIETVLDHQTTGWMAPPADPTFAADAADGLWVDFLLSVGPFDLPPDSTVTFTIAVVGGEGLHKDPNNFRDFFDAERPELYFSRLDFSDLLRNVQWAKWTYDNPGVDTDGDGFAGEWYLRGGDTVYYRGDGVPDIRAALPPYSPVVRVATRGGRITLNWNGYRTEIEKDVFTERRDFEGYRVYLSRTGFEKEWSYLTQRDLLNYSRYTWNARKNKWVFGDPPYTRAELKDLYDTLTLRQYGFAFEPDSFTVARVDRGLLEVHYDPAQPEKLDSIYRHFGPYEANNLPDDTRLALAADGGIDVKGVVRKLYPLASPDSVAVRDDGEEYRPYYEYEYVLDGLLPSEPVFVAVTAFDHGDPATELAPLESSRAASKQEIWPINSAEVVKEERPKPGVYPNPYRISDYYNAAGWENPRGLEPDPERARKVTFYNVPDTCVVSLWSIDGDLVRRLEHRADPSSSEATVVVWNLITRNTQAVKTGIYIYSIESRFGTDVGKLVIVK